MKIGIFGFGAVGASIYNELNEYNDLYILMDEKRKEKYKDGININDKHYNLNIITSGIMDLIIVAVKNYDLETSFAELEKYVDKNTIILPLLNGVTAKDRLNDYFKDNKVLYGLILLNPIKMDLMYKQVK